MRGLRIFALTSSLGVAACTPTTELGEGTTQPTRKFDRTRGSAVLLTRDERVAVVANRSAGLVTVLSLDPGAPLDQLLPSSACASTLPKDGSAPTCTEINLGADSEPWAAVLGPDDDTAYVVLRSGQAVRRIVGLHAAPRLDSQSVRVGSEPTAIAIAPSGRRLFVANWGEGTVSLITIPDFVNRGALDLNEALSRLPDLGAPVPRPALAHPRALAITDDGDEEDDDETLYATEFFSQPLWQKEDSDDPMQFDRNRQGIVYATNLGTQGISLVTIQPVRNTGFPDSNRAATGCFPNQLYAAATDGARLFVTAMCASPAGPLDAAPRVDQPDNTDNFKTLAHPVVFVIDRATNRERPEQRLVLTEKLEALYAEDESKGVLATRRMPLIPNDIAIASGESAAFGRACLTALGADAVFCFHDDAGGWTVGSPGARYVDLGSKGGRLPVGIALSRRTSPGFALVANEATQNLSVIDWSGATVSQAREANSDPTNKGTPEKQGRGFFATGLGIWSFKGQAWSSCESCHPDGLSDGVTWFFTRGPRRTLSTAPTFTPTSAGLEQKILLWGGNVDEIHDVEVIVRRVAGGVGAVLRDYPLSTPSNELRISYDGALSQAACQDTATGIPTPKCTSTLLNNLNGSLAELVSDANTPVKDWEAIKAYIESVRTPRQPGNLASARVARGREQFIEGRCAGCHGGPAWTLSRRFYPPGEWATGKLPYDASGVTRSVVQASLGALRTTSYTVSDAALRKLNPPASVNGAAALRRWVPPPDAELPAVDDPLVKYAYDKKTGLEDQINCVLRDVGTFPPAAAGVRGIATTDAPQLREVRQDMTTLALGDTGFNIPSLLGLATGAPYFHAGNARTLEELFDPVFAAHYQALTPGFLADGANRFEAIQDLVAFLLSLDDGAEAVPVGAGDDLCPTELRAPER